MKTLLPCPAVSVIIPIYNAENYIAECLDSILNQTFQDFEVIAVDDCSTDNSPAIAESYVEKFGKRMISTRTQKNSGNAGYTARNKGFKFARGEYVFFVDADDFISKTALEELYTLAKNFDADVVYTGARYRYTAEEGAILTRDRIGRSFLTAGLEEKPTLTINDPRKNLDALLLEKPSLYWVPWTKFVRRDFLIEHEITFSEILSGGDFLWTIELFAYAERFLRNPNAVYYWRDDSSLSITRLQREPEKQIAFWFAVIVAMINSMNALSNKIELLKENPQYVYEALRHILKEQFKRSNIDTKNFPPEKVFEFLCREFEGQGIDLPIPFFLSVIDSQEKDLLAAQRRIVDLEEELKSLKVKE